MCISCSVVSNSLRPHGRRSLPGSSVHGILQTRILEWIAIPFSRGSSRPRDWTQVSFIVGRFFTIWATREAPFNIYSLRNTAVVNYYRACWVEGMGDGSEWWIKVERKRMSTMWEIVSILYFTEPLQDHCEAKITVFMSVRRKLKFEDIMFSAWVRLLGSSKARD